MSILADLPGGGDPLAGVPRVPVEIDGRIDAPQATVLLHGAGADGRQLCDLARRLAPPCAIRPTLRGHRGSLEPGWGYSPLESAADLQRWAHRWPAQLDFVGYSYGALVAALCAATWGAARIRSLVVLDTSFEAFPGRHVQDADAEGSWLRWTYDYRGVLDHLDIPALVLRSRDGDLIGEGEAERLGTLRHVTVRTLSGDHASMIEDTNSLSEAIHAWR